MTVLWTCEPWMRPFDPYIDPATGNLWYDPPGAARVTRTVSDDQWRRWALAKETSFGLRLDTSSVALRRSGHDRPRSDRAFRLVIAESSVLAVRAIFDEVFGVDREIGRHQYTKEEREDLRDATGRHYFRTRERLRVLSR